MRGSLKYYLADIYPLHNLLSAAHHMSESSLRVARYIVENPQDVASMSIGELAKASGSSKTAVVRVSKLSGYQGYRGLRAALIENRGVLRGAELMSADLTPGAEGADNPSKLARGVARINIEVLQDTLTLLDEGTLLRAADTILSAKHVFLVGFGTSAPVVQDAYQRFLMLQVPSSSVPKSAAAELSDVVLISAVRRTPLTPENVAARVARFVVIDIICAIIIALRKRSEPDEWTERMTAEPSKRPKLNWVERANQESPKIR